MHIEDICSASVCCLDAPADSIRNQVFNVGDTAENYRNEQGVGKGIRNSGIDRSEFAAFEQQRR